MGGRKSVEIRSKCRIHIGSNGSFAMGGVTYWSISQNAKMVFWGDATFSKGTQLICDGVIEFGQNFYCNFNCIINSGKYISFGDDVLVGWEVTILDGDGHNILKQNVVTEKYQNIVVGNHVWIASYAKILKGSHICDNSVIAMNSLCSKSFSDSNIMIGGINKIINTNIDWSK